MDIPKEVGLYGTVLAFILKDVFLSFKSNQKEHTKAIQENTLAITKLEVQLDHTNQKLAEVPSMRKDIDAAHEAIRSLKAAFASKDN